MAYATKPIKRKRDGQLVCKIQAIDDQGKRRSEWYEIKANETATKKIEKEINEEKANFEKAVKNGTDYTDGKKITFNRLVREWDETGLSIQVEDGDITEGCREKYLRMMELYVSPVMGNTHVVDIKPLHINKIIKQMSEKGLSKKTIRNCINCLHLVLEYGRINDLIPNNPCDKASAKPKAPKKKAKAINIKKHTFSVDQAVRFLLEALQMDIPRLHSWSKQEDQLFFTLALYGGFRKSELLALTWDDIDENHMVVEVNKAVGYNKAQGEYMKDPKTEAGNRSVPIPPECIDLLRKWKTVSMQICIKAGSKWQGQRADFNKNYIFHRANGLRIPLTEPYKHFRSIIAAYNETVPDDKKLPDLRLHDLRHTCISHKIVAGAPLSTVQKDSGHSKLSTTTDFYAHAIEENNHVGADMLEKLYSAQAN